MFNHTVIRSVQTPSGQLSAGTKQYQGAANNELSSVIAIGGTNVLLNFAAKVAEIKSVVIVCDQNLTLKTNSSSSPANTLNLLANVPYIWNADSYDTLKLTVDVTALYVTNGSGVAAQFDVRCLYDPTL